MPASPAVTAALLAWYDRHRRTLPWRTVGEARPDPYAVWLSEVMLQQTTVAAVKGFYARFLALWPDVASLAAAPREAVLREWAGLGYYARARNLHDCAQAVVARHGGLFPPSEAGLRALPGIGDYTAAAVAAIAFGEAATVVDGNVERVMARLHAVERLLPGARPEIRRLTAALVPPARPGDFAQAMMDLGATICTPKSPACALCPLTDACVSRRAGTQTSYPRKLPKKAIPRRFGAMAVVERADGAILVRTRAASGLLGGMTEFFGSDWGPSAPDPAALSAGCGATLALVGRVEHVFTHFALSLDVYRGRSHRGVSPDRCRWIPPSAMAGEPLPNLVVKVWDAASAVVPLGQDSPRLVGLEGPDQEHARQGADREKKARHRSADRGHMAEARGGGSGAKHRQSQNPTQHGTDSTGGTRRGLT